MNFEITEDNRPFLEARGKIILNACPGSGKTSAISYKLTQLTAECNKKYGKYSGVLCLSFTNVAKDEILDKYKSISGCTLGYPHVVSTIDSFINQYITLPFFYLLKSPKGRPSIVNSLSFLDSLNFRSYRTKTNSVLQYSYPPSSIKIEINNTYTCKGKSPDTDKVDAAVFNNYASTIKKWQFDNGYLSNDDSTYFAFFLLKKFKEIGLNLVSRFPYIIVDEAQDTSEAQYKIFDLLIQAGLSNIEFVGDPYQSLYEFREARPDLFVNRFEDNANWKAFQLTNCRRSSQKIVDFYSLFRRSSEQSIASLRSFSENNPIHVFRYTENNISSLVERYQNNTDIDSANRILVRGASHLELFGVKATKEEPWHNSTAKDLLSAQHLFLLGEVKDSIDKMRDIIIELKYSEKDFQERQVLRKTLKEDVNLNTVMFDFLAHAPSNDDTLENWTQMMELHLKKALDLEVDLKLKQKGRAYVSSNLKKLLLAEPDVLYPVSTIHKVKGMTFESILLVLSKDSSGQNLSLNDFVKPDKFPSEKQRLIYVALSRPQTLCCLAIPEEVSEGKIRGKLGNDIVFVN
jgi:DNA helicase-2/ATP-dependent DNA helicase PcrA